MDFWILSLVLGVGCLACLALCVQGQSSGDLRLVSNSGSTGGSSGRLEVYFSFRWGTVCDDGFGREEALVACKQLGYAGVSSYDRVGDIGFRQPSSSTSIWLDDVSCIGTESRLQFCRNRGIGVENCSHSEDIGLICSNIDVLGLIVGLIVGIIGVVTICGIICCVVCCCCINKKTNRYPNTTATPRIATIQPTPSTVVYTTTTPNQRGVGTGYPTQSYPVSRAPQMAPSPYATQQMPPSGAYTTPSYPTQAQEMYPPQQPVSGYPPEPANPELFPSAPPPYNELAAYPPPSAPGYPPTDPNAGY